MQIFLKILFVMLSLNLVSACGVKGKLKTPEQIEKAEAKKAAKAAKEEDKQEEKK